MALKRKPKTTALKVDVTAAAAVADSASEPVYENPNDDRRNPSQVVDPTAGMGVEAPGPSAGEDPAGLAGEPTPTPAPTPAPTPTLPVLPNPTPVPAPAPAPSSNSPLWVEASPGVPQAPTWVEASPGVPQAPTWVEAPRH